MILKAVDAVRFLCLLVFRLFIVFPHDPCIFLRKSTQLVQPVDQGESDSPNAQARQIHRRCSRGSSTDPSSVAESALHASIPTGRWRRINPHAAREGWFCKLPT